MKQISLVIFFVVILTGVLALAALWSTKEPKVTTEMPVVMTSTYPLFFLAERISGAHFTVKNITPPGAEPHDYEPTPRDFQQMEHSALVVINGKVEHWAEALSSSPSVQLLVMNEALRTSLPEGTVSDDPHTWLSPVIMQAAALSMKDALIAADPEHAKTYENNAGTLIVSLRQLDQEFRTGLATCTRRDIVTAHDAFGYLAREYGLNPVAISGISPDAEPSPKQLADITETVRAHGTTVIFFEELASPKLAETLAKETGARTLVLNPLEGLTKANLENGSDYLSVMRENLANLRTALSCTP